MNRPLRVALQICLLTLGGCLEREVLGAVSAPDTGCGVDCPDGAQPDPRAQFIRELAHGVWRGTATSKVTPDDFKHISLEFTLEGSLTARCIEPSVEEGEDCMPFPNGIVVSGRPIQYRITDVIDRVGHGISFFSLGESEVDGPELREMKIVGNLLTFEHLQLFAASPDRVVLMRTE